MLSQNRWRINLFSALPIDWIILTVSGVCFIKAGNHVKVENRSPAVQKSHAEYVYVYLMEKELHGKSY